MGGLLRPALRGRPRRPADLRRRRASAPGTPWPTRWTRTSAAGAPAPGWSATWPGGAAAGQAGGARRARRRRARRRPTSGCSPSPPAPGTRRPGSTSGWPATSACRPGAAAARRPHGLLRGAARAGRGRRLHHGPGAAVGAALLELTSLHVQPPSTDVEQVVAHALFSDAAAAVVVEPAERPGFEVLDVVARTDVTTADHMTWDVTDLGFRMGLSPRVPDVLARHVGGVVDELLAAHGLRSRRRRRLGGAPGRPADPRRRAAPARAGRGRAGALVRGAARPRQLLLGHGAAGAGADARGRDVAPGRPRGAGVRPGI